MLSNLQAYANCLLHLTNGGTCHMNIFVGFSKAPAKIVANIGWWLQSMDQGFSECPLQHAEETICLGWLLCSSTGN